MASSGTYALAFENARSGLLLLETATGRVLEANASFLRLVARGIDDVTGRNFWEPPLIADAGAGAEVFQHLRAGGSVEGVELPLQTGDGCTKLLEVCGGPAGNSTLLEVRDATLREQARLAERMDTLRGLAGRTADEFQNLHRTLRMIGELLLAASGQGRPILRELEEVQQATERASAIAGQLAAFSGKSAVDARPLALNNLILSMLPRLRQLFGRDIEIIHDLGSDLEPVSADPAQVRQIVLRLAANSRDAMPGGGTFCVQTRDVPTEDDTAPYVMLAVSDNGPGFDDRSWAHVFEPFAGDQANGRLGLSLASVHGIVRRSGGRVWAYSQPGKGATFRIYLPQARAHFPALRAVGSATILLVEPNDRLRTMMANQLKGRGYRVLAALHPQEAFRIVEAQGPPDLLISRPDQELADHLARLQSELRVLFLGGDDDGLAHSTRFAVLRNPFEPKTFLDAVSKLLTQ